MNRALPYFDCPFRAVKHSVISYLIYVLLFIIQAYLSDHIASHCSNSKSWKKKQYTIILVFVSSFSEDEIQLILNDLIHLLPFQSAAS